LEDYPYLLAKLFQRPYPLGKIRHFFRYLPNFSTLGVLIYCLFVTVLEKGKVGIISYSHVDYLTGALLSPLLEYPGYWT
jgi:hypothetical protein